VLLLWWWLLLLLLLLDRRVVALRRAVKVVDCAPPCSCSTGVMRGRRGELMLWLWLMLVLWLLLRWSLRLWRTVVLEPWHVGSIVAVVAGQVCVLVCAPPALVSCVVVRAANLTEHPCAGVGPAAERSRGYVPVFAALVQAGVLGYCCEVDAGCCWLLLILLDRCSGEVNAGWLLELLLSRWALLPGYRLLPLLLLLRVWRAGLELLLILMVLLLLATALVSTTSAAARRCAASQLSLRLT